MAMVRADIATVVVAGGPIPSLLILKPRSSSDGTEALPIRIGTADAMAIGLGIDPSRSPRPMTHDLLKNALGALDALVTNVEITDVKGSTFYAQVNMMKKDGTPLSLDARPSDAVALAVRTKAPIFVSKNVFDVAGYPDFETAKKEAQRASVAEFDKFVENLTPSDFTGTSDEDYKS